MPITNASAGIKFLSQLGIDADKDWNAKGISDLKELALGMVQGDIIVRGAGGVLIRLPPGIANMVLTSNGPGNIPSWQPGGLYLSRYFPETISLSKAVNKNTTRSHAQTKGVSIATSYADVTGDSPGSRVKMLAPAIAVPHSAVHNPTRSHTQSYAPSVARRYDLQIVVGGATRAPGGADVDETAAAQNATLNDMNLPPQTPGVGDAYRFGHAKMFDSIILRYDTQGVGVWAVTWKYWNGAWVALAGVTDPTNGFTAAAGTYEIVFTRPGDWALNNILGMNLYWVSAEVTSYFSRTSQPMGSQAWIKIVT